MHLEDTRRLKLPWSLGGKTRGNVIESALHTDDHTKKSSYLRSGMSVPSGETLDGYFESLAAHIRSAICIYRYDLPWDSVEEGETMVYPTKGSLERRSRDLVGRYSQWHLHARSEKQIFSQYVVALKSERKDDYIAGPNRYKTAGRM